MGDKQIKDKMDIETIRWKNNRVELIDQRILPGRLRYVPCLTSRDIWKAIKVMKIRGAPAIGIAGAYGVYLGIRKSRARSFNSFKKELDKTIEYLAGSRPTARNLFWGLERMNDLVEGLKDKPVSEIKSRVLSEAHKILDEDFVTCRAIGRQGEKLIKKDDCILTHCNAGGLATGGYGTAVGVIFSSHKKIRMVYVDETRPLLQGARLTAWELVKKGIPSKLICDNMAASFMKKKKINVIIVGADRIAANGDTANKIGTYGLAVLARHHSVPFYVAAPASTFDLSLSTGSSIPIEERSGDEVRKINGEYITVKGVDTENPAFDVTPRDLITAIITEHGIIKKPDKKKVRAMIGGSNART